MPRKSPPLLSSRGDDLPASVAAMGLAGTIATTFPTWGNKRGGITLISSMINNLDIFAFIVIDFGGFDD